VERTIETQIEINASPEQVWHAWTDSDEFAAWWGEDGLYRVTKWTGDLRPGGKWRSDGLLADGSPFYVEGEYLKVDPPNALSFTWRHDWDEKLSETIVHLEFHKTKEGTLLKLRHSGFATDKALDDHKKGWARVLGWLSTHLEARPHDLHRIQESNK
jgi:uncharacterized protein YndB with AHSA1/START domain